MNKVSCIVVGAGPAGSACAYSLARKGIETVVLERGRDAGDKNVASFLLIPGVLKHLIPDYRESAPLERTVTEFPVLQLGERDFLKTQGRFYDWIDTPLGFTAYRSRFDAWFAGKAKEAGAEIIPGMTATDLIMDKGRVIGVKVGEDELFADVVVGADGAHSLMAERAGLIPRLDTMKTHLAVKEVLDLAPEAIEERFQLGKDEGCCIHGLGCYPVDDIGGFFTMYTNRDSLTLSIMGTVKLLADKQVKLYERLNLLKAHPYIAALIRGSQVREYQAHILSYGGRVDPKKVYADGFLLCGEAGGFLNAYKVGVPTGMLTGMMAAETIAWAKSKGDFSVRNLKYYRNFLRSSAILDIVSQTAKINNYYSRKGIQKIPVYSRTATKLFEEIPKDGFDFIGQERFSFGGLIYKNIIEDFLPAFVRWPVNFLVRIIARGNRILKRIKARRTPYVWK